eukprot:Transcript_1668.p4 GENE.Transcript_1668~~Transcript_1668.p4  ORF type:complete len:182 (-),score=20.05 Transcript_1668:670-1215(-)
MAAALALGEAALVQVWYKPGTPDKPDKPGSENEGGDDAPAHDVSTWRALCTRPLPLVLGYRSAAGLYLYLLWDVFPLYGIASPAVGGLALDHAALGTLIAGASSLQLLYMTACQTRLIRRHGVRRMVLRQVGDAGPGGSANRAACPSSAKATPRAALRLGAAQANRAAWDACPVRGGPFPT